MVNMQTFKVFKRIETALAAIDKVGKRRNVSSKPRLCLYRDVFLFYRSRSDVMNLRGQTRSADELVERFGENFRYWSMCRKVGDLVVNCKINIKKARSGTVQYLSYYVRDLPDRDVRKVVAMVNRGAKIPKIEAYLIEIGYLEMVA